MAKEIINIDNSDNSGGVETFTEQTASTLTNDSTLFHYYNGWDVGATVAISGSRAGDDDFSEAVEINSESVSSGGNAGFYVVTDPWDQVEISVTPNADPSSGSFKTYRSDDN